MSCKLRDFNIKAKEGDVISFIMPAFCSGDYVYKVTKDKNGVLVLKDAPERIFDGCYDFKIKKKK